MYEKKLKHLDFIQVTITRMAANSFLLKGWGITLVSAVFALSAKDADPLYIFIAYFPVPLFWALDSFFVSKERQFRKLYDKVRKLDEEEIDFNMSVKEFESMSDCMWARVAFSQTLIIYYGAVVLTLLTVIWILINK